MIKVPDHEGTPAAVRQALTQFQQDFPHVQNFEISCDLALILTMRDGEQVAMEVCDLPGRLVTSHSSLI